MKYIITESQDNKMVERLTNGVKYNGWNETAKLVGGYENLIKVLGINSPMDFLHLFDGLDVVQSKVEKNWTLFRYKPNQNLMIYNRKNDDVYINYYEIWSVLTNKFELNYSEIQQLTKEWLAEVYNLRGNTTILSQTPRGRTVS